MRFLMKSLGLALAFAAVHGASAFSVFGPAESWQTPTLDYVDRYYYPEPGVHDIEIGAPKNFGQGSRLNIPIVTYGFDITFLEYFGSQGVAAVDAAMATLNALPASSSAKLANYIMQGNEQVNYTAQALELTDLKSTVLSLMMEHMGLIGETHVWDLHTRNAVAGPPPCLFEYLVINRNYDPATYQPSSYVNGINYGYDIWDGCSNSVSVADAIEMPIDEASDAELTYSAVATRYGLEPGGFYLNITYDDMGGLKYLYSKNNLAYESLDSNSVVATLGGGTSTGGSPWLGESGGTNGTGTTTGGTTGAGTTVTTSNLVALMGGVEKITYVKVPYNSLGATNLVPVSYNYNVTAFVNGRLASIPVTRTINQPDIIFSAGDLVGNTLGGAPFTYSAYARGFGFIPGGAIVPGNGVEPETITPQETILFNNVTPTYVNQSPSFLSSQNSFYTVLAWGSFDGSTNAPVMYPQSSSLTSLLNELTGLPGSTGSLSTLGGSTWTGLTLSLTNGLNLGTGTTAGGTP
jgi:hypothetical protein